MRLGHSVAAAVAVGLLIAQAANTWAAQSAGTEQSNLEKPTSSSPPPAIPQGLTILTYVHDTSEGKQSLGASGHAILFERPAKARFVEAVEMFAGRYGTPEPPKEDFHLYLLNEKFQPLADLRYPYGMIERGDLRMVHATNAFH